MPLISPLGSVYIPIDDPYEGIIDEQITKIIIPCSISLGNSEGGVVGSLRRMEPERAAPHKTHEAI